MNNSEKKELLEKAIKTLINGDGFYICTSIEKHINLGVFEVFPELLNYKPEDKQIYNVWWPPDEEHLKLRISILEEIKKNYDN